MTCSNSQVFPAAWLNNAQYFLHATSDICCQKMFGGDPSCQVDNWCVERNQVAQDESDQVAAEKAIEQNQVGGGTEGGGSSTDCSTLKWHVSIAEERTCSNSEEFPAAWLANPEFFLHATSEICCQITFGENCEITDVCTETDEGNLGGGGNQGPESETTTVLTSDGEDDFEGDGTLPWVLGTPPEWEIDENVAFTGTKSMRNIPALEVSAVRSLNLHTNLSTASTLSCKLKLDISMPFDRFSLVVNGVVRMMYLQHEDNWATLTTVINPGENTIEFTVTNSDMFPFDRSTQAMFGTGHVWLDACTLHTNS